MSSESTTPPGEASPSTPGLGETPSPRKKGSGCWKAFIAVCILLVLGTSLVIWTIVSTVNYFKDTRETAPAIAQAPDLTALEEVELQTIYRTYVDAWNQKKDFDVTFTTSMFNALIKREIQRKKDRGESNAQDPESMQIAFDGPVLVIKGSFPNTDENDKTAYYNIEARGTLKIKDEKGDWQLDSMKIADKQAPWGAMALLRLLLKAGIDERKKAGDSPFKGIKLLEREGERVHLIMAAEHLKEPRN